MIMKYKKENELFDATCLSIRATDMIDRAINFHNDNPIVFKTFSKIAFETLNGGRKKYSSDMVWNVMRWHVNVKLKYKTDKKFNDHYKAFFTRLFIAKYPRNEKFFEIRKSAFDNVYYDKIIQTL